MSRRVFNKCLGFINCLIQQFLYLYIFFMLWISTKMWNSNFCIKFDIRLKYLTSFSQLYSADLLYVHNFTDNLFVFLIIGNLIVNMFIVQQQSSIINFFTKQLGLLMRSHCLFKLGHVSLRQQSLTEVAILKGISQSVHIMIVWGKVSQSNIVRPVFLYSRLVDSHIRDRFLSELIVKMIFIQVLNSPI